MTPTKTQSKSVTPPVAGVAPPDTTRQSVDQPLMGHYATYHGDDVEDGPSNGQRVVTERVVSYKPDGQPDEVIVSQQNGSQTLFTVSYDDLKGHRSRSGR
jgi:hypothetical protein